MRLPLSPCVAHRARVLVQALVDALDKEGLIDAERRYGDLKFIQAKV